ncbi:MAG: nucleotidyltransferase family protein [Clostridia bacterium]|nr:nucleotidyltransferase family protein [Clostridia bacterium]
MNERGVATMFALIRQVLCDKPLTEEEKSRLTPELLPSLYALSKAHDMAHVVAQALSDLGMLGTDEISAKFQKQMMLAVYRYQQLSHDLQKLCQTLEAAEIPFLPLKGSVLRALYPQPWMRTSCDIDVLVKEADLQRAGETLTEQLHWTQKQTGSHDVLFSTASGMTLELHYTLIEEQYRTHDTLLRIWELVTPIDGAQYQMEMPDEVFYFYHVAHMAKHFEEGGCGVRPFLDLWILAHCVEHDGEARDRLLEREGLLKLAEACRHLSEVWFGDAMHDDTSRQVESYILTGGLFGTVDNRVAVHQNKKGGKFRYVMSRIFLPYEQLKFLYPVLQKHKWLTPLMEVRRWFRLLFKGRWRRAARELRLNQSVSQEQMENTAQLLERLGL